MTVQDVKPTEAIHGLSGKPIEGDCDQLAMELPDNPPPLRPWRNRRHEGDMSFLGMKSCSSDEPFL